jgi:hypothetical protein
MEIRNGNHLQHKRGRAVVNGNDSASLDKS